MPCLGTSLQSELTRWPSTRLQGYSSASNVSDARPESKPKEETAVPEWRIEVQVLNASDEGEARYIAANLCRQGSRLVKAFPIEAGGGR